MSIYTNHVGYLPNARKIGLAGGRQHGGFEVVRDDTGDKVFKGTLTWRTIDTVPAETFIQWIYVLFQARMALLFGADSSSPDAEPIDPEYAAQCRAAAERCLAWVVDDPGAAGRSSESPLLNHGGTVGRGAAAAALVEMARVDVDQQLRYLEGAVAHARAILHLQLRRELTAAARSGASSSRSQGRGKRSEPRSRTATSGTVRGTFSGC